VDGAIFEPLYYQIDVEKPSSPSEAFQFCKIHRDPLKWELIYQLSSGSVKNPNLIYEGQTLDIPKA
jgi:hypothetical protein